MNKLIEPEWPASEKTTSLTAKLRIEGIPPEEARKAYRIWGRACGAMTNALQRDYGAQVNVIITPEDSL